MKVIRCLAVLGLLVAAATPAAAQVVTLEFKNGRVKLVTENAPISVILAEWARRGRTTIVNGERIPGPPATLQLVDVTEREALDIVLRGASGYMMAERDSPVNGASAFDRILILPTSRVTTGSSSPLPSPAAQAAQAVQSAIVDDDDDGPPPFVPGQPGQRTAAPLPPGVRVPPQPQQEPIRLPPGVAVSGAGVPPVDRGVNEDDQRPAPAPSNPFGVAPGSSQPGVITPVPQRPQR